MATRITETGRLNKLLAFMNSDHCIYSSGRKWDRESIDAAIRAERASKRRGGRK